MIETDMVEVLLALSETIFVTTLIIYLLITWKV